MGQPKTNANSRIPGKRFERVMLKLSGEVFGGKSGTGFDYDVIRAIAGQVAEVAATGVKVGLVVGGGNIFRGMRTAPPGMDRVTGDHMGMLATVINAICLQDALESMGTQTRVMTAIEIRSVAEPYIKRRMQRHLEMDRVVIFGAGTGHPFFTTDTAAALRASEMSADVLIKCTKVDGVYDKDPEKHSDAVRLGNLTYQEVIRNELGVMDTTAIAFCKDNAIPILVMNMEQPGSLMKAVDGGDAGTWVE